MRKRDPPKNLIWLTGGGGVENIKHKLYPQAAAEVVPQHFRTNKKIWQETDSSLRVYEEQLEKETSMAMIKGT